MAQQEQDKPIVRPKSVRLVTIVVIALAVACYWLLARAVQGINYRLAPSTTVNQILDNLPLLEPLLFFFELVSPSVLRHFLPVLFGIFCGWIITIQFVQQLYDLDTFADARQTLMRLWLGSSVTVGLNRQTFSEQQIDEELMRVGGPGYVVVAESDVAATEINGRFERVLGSGRHRLRRFEKVVAILDLREQERTHNNITLMTKEGLELTTDLRINFHIRRQPDPNNPLAAYTFHDESVRKAAFNISIGQGGVLRWDDQPMRIAIAQLRRVVAGKRLDELIDPKYVFEAAPHPEVQIALEQDTRDILDLSGIYLVSARTTALKMSPAMHETLIGYWKAFGEKAKALDERPQDPDFDSADLARRRAREKMIASLTTGLQTIREHKNATVRRPPPKPPAVQQPDVNQLLTIQLIRLLQNVNAQSEAARPTQPQVPQADTDSPRLLEQPKQDLDAQLDALLGRFLPPSS